MTKDENDKLNLWMERIAKEKKIVIIDDIARAILTRLNLGDLEDIYEGQKFCWYAAMNLGNNSQLDAQEKVAQMINKAISNMIEHDLNNILQVIDEAVKSYN